MRLIGLMLARNSDWIIGASARAALQWCDGLVVFAHACTDDTLHLVRDVEDIYPDRVRVIVEESPVWDEMDHRQRTLIAAREMGATHVANVDDDEIVTANVVPELRQAAAMMAPGDCLNLPWISMWGGLDGYRDDDTHWSRTQVDTIFADCPGMHYRKAGDGYQHHSRRPKGNTGKVHVPVAKQDLGGMMHFQFSSQRRLKAKQALYKMWEITRWPGKRTVDEINRMYDGTTFAPGLHCAEVPKSWWTGMDHLRQYINLDAEPWQEFECHRMLHEFGAEKFAGLDLYGVVP